MFTINCDQTSLLDKLDQFVTKQISVTDTTIIKVKPNLITVGPYRVITQGPRFNVTKGPTVVCEFLKRSWAAGYAICLVKSNNAVAEKLLSTNKKYTKLREDRSFYNYHIKRNAKNNNFNRVVMFENRLSRTLGEINELEDSIFQDLKSLSI
jgi:hypothetical protein